MSYSLQTIKVTSCQYQLLFIYISELNDIEQFK
jgi:hypothetical protein